VTLAVNRPGSPPSVVTERVPRRDLVPRRAGMPSIGCPERLGRCHCTQPAGHTTATLATGHVYVHASSAPDRKAD
jgi:hypothetical protein